MSTKNPNQRRHYVLARNRAAAEPILDTLRKNGLKSENVLFLDSVFELSGKQPNELTFIYGPEYSKHGIWPALREQVNILIGLGATVKPVPVQPLMDQMLAEAKEKAQKPAERAHVESTPWLENPAVRKLREAEEDLKGGLWDLLGKPVQQNAEGEYEEAPPPPPKFKQYYLGGPKNAQRRRDVLNSARHESFPRPDLRADVFTSYSSLPPEECATYYTYSAWPVSVLGEELTFWIHENDWDDRQRLVREFLLSPLEI